MEQHRDAYGPLPTPPPTPTAIRQQNKTKWQRRAATAVIVTIGTAGVLTTANPEQRADLKATFGDLVSAITGK